mgnify:CR=1 FL=1
MPRVLSLVRAWVAADTEPEYLDTVHRLAARLGVRGQRLWLFRSREHPDRYIEFTEGHDPATHRVAGPADEIERELELQLHDFARYDADPVQLGDEVPLDDGEAARGATHH